MWKKNESGQSLLVIVMLISIVFTIIATASYRLTTETQSTRLQEESIRTLAAADSGIETGIQYAYNNAETPSGSEVTFLDLGITLPGVNPEESTLQITADEGTQFMSPLLQKDDQYTFYLFKYPDGGDNKNQNVYVHFADSLCPSASGPALELTLIYGTSGQFLQRWIADPCSIVASTSGEITAGAFNFVLDTITLRYRVQVPISLIATGAAPAQLLIVRTIGESTNVGFSSTGGGNTLFSQGQTIRSQAVSSGGISKIVTLFKSYPQIPADLFVTRF